MLSVNCFNYRMKRFAFLSIVSLNLDLYREREKASANS